MLELNRVEIEKLKMDKSNLVLDLSCMRGFGSPWEIAASVKEACSSLTNNLYVVVSSDKEPEDIMCIEWVVKGALMSALSGCKLEIVLLKKYRQPSSLIFGVGDFLRVKEGNTHHYGYAKEINKDSLTLELLLKSKSPLPFYKELADVESTGTQSFEFPLDQVENLGLKKEIKSEWRQGSTVEVDCGGFFHYGYLVNKTADNITIILAIKTLCKVEDARITQHLMGILKTSFSSRDVKSFKVLVY